MTIFIVICIIMSGTCFGAYIKINNINGEKVLKGETDVSVSYDTQYGRVYLNKNTKKYDAILNDAFAGESPAKTLTTLEAIEEIYNSLNENGVYLTNIISSIEGKNSKFIKAEVNTLKQVFKNVYVVPCSDRNDLELTQNNMVIATDDELTLDNTTEVNLDNSVLLTDNYCPVESLVPHKKQ